MAVTMSAEERTKYMDEISMSHRIVVYENEPYVIVLPTQQYIFDSKIIYSKVLNNLLKMDVPSRVQARLMLNKVLTEAGKDPAILERREKVMLSLASKMRDDMPQEKVTDYLKSTNGLMVYLNEFMNKISEDERRVLMEASEVAEIEEQYLSTCAETQAAMQQDFYLLVVTVRNADGNPIWVDLQAILDEQDGTKLAFFRNQLGRLVAGEPSEFEVNFMGLITENEDLLKNE